MTTVLDLPVEMLLIVTEYLNDEQIYVLMQQNRFFYNLFLPTIYCELDTRNLLKGFQLQWSRRHISEIDERFLKLDKYVMKSSAFFGSEKDLAFDRFNNLVDFKERVISTAYFDKLLAIDAEKFGRLKVYSIKFSSHSLFEVSKLGALLTNLRKLSLDYSELKISHLTSFTNQLKTLNLKTTTFESGFFLMLQDKFMNLRKLSLDGHIQKPNETKRNMIDLKHLSLKGSINSLSLLHYIAMYFPNLISLNFESRVKPNSEVFEEIRNQAKFNNLNVLVFKPSSNIFNTPNRLYQDLITPTNFPKLTNLNLNSSSDIDLYLWKLNLRVLNLNNDLIPNYIPLYHFVNLKVLHATIPKILDKFTFEAMFTQLSNLTEMCLTTNSYFSTDLPNHLTDPTFFAITPIVPVRKLILDFALPATLSTITFLTNMHTLLHLDVKFSPNRKFDTASLHTEFPIASAKFKNLVYLGLKETPNGLCNWFLQVSPNLITFKFNDRLFHYDTFIKTFANTANEKSDWNAMFNIGYLKAKENINSFVQYLGLK